MGLGRGAPGSAGDLEWLLEFPGWREEVFGEGEERCGKYGRGSQSTRRWRRREEEVKAFAFVGSKSQTEAD